MKRIALLLAALALVCAPVSAQNILNQLKNRAKQEVRREVNKGVNDVLNGKTNTPKGNKQDKQQSQQQQQAPAQQTKQQAPAAQADTWVCPDCGTVNTGKFCVNCGAKKPEGGAAASTQNGTVSAEVATQKLMSYSCDVYEDKVLVSRQYVDGTKARIEDLDGTIAIIKDAKLYALDPTTKTCSVLSMDDAFKGNSNLTIAKWLGSESPIKTETEIKALDSEVIDGVDCRHYIAYVKTIEGGTINGQKMNNTLDSETEVWEHPQWGIPLQVKTDRIINYRNIVPGPQPKEKFEVPAGYEVNDLSDVFGALMKGLPASK